jgi:hypothetical protein
MQEFIGCPANASLVHDAPQEVILSDRQDPRGTASSPSLAQEHAFSFVSPASNTRQFLLVLLPIHSQNASNESDLIRFSKT